MAHDGDLAKSFVFANGMDQQIPILPTSITTRRQSAFHQHWDTQGFSNHRITSTMERKHGTLLGGREESSS